MPTVSPSLVARNLRAACEVLSLYPYQSLQDALERIGATLAGIPVDLLDLCGAEACEAEIVVLCEEWAA